jgi:hypothetical protein
MQTSKLSYFKLRHIVALGASSCLAISSVADAAIVVNSFQNIAPDGGGVHDPHNPSSSGAPDQFSASGSDLAEGLSATVTYTGGTGTTTNEGSAGESVWTDGSISTVYPEGGPGGDAIDHAAYGTVDGRVGGAALDTLVTYDFGGFYNISQIDVYLGWNDSGRDDSSFNILVSADNIGYSQIGAYTKPADNTGAFTTPVTNLHRVIDDGSANIAEDIRYVQLQFTDADNGFAGLTEVDVMGTAVPEPSVPALFGLAGLLAFIRRRGRS